MDSTVKNVASTKTLNEMIRTVEKDISFPITNPYSQLLKSSVVPYLDGRPSKRPYNNRKKTKGRNK